MDIYKYIGRDSPERAEAYLLRIEDRIALVAEQPGIGTVRLRRFPELRVFPVGSHLLFYRALAQGGIELIRVLHGARDWPAIMGDDPG